MENEQEYFMERTKKFIYNMEYDCGLDGAIDVFLTYDPEDDLLLIDGGYSGDFADDTNNKTCAIVNKNDRIYRFICKCVDTLRMLVDEHMSIVDYYKTHSDGENNADIINQMCELYDNDEPPFDKDDLEDIEEGDINVELDDIKFYIYGVPRFQYKSNEVDFPAWYCDNEQKGALIPLLVDYLEIFEAFKKDLEELRSDSHDA